MTPGEQAARDALMESVRQNKVEVQLASETITLLRSEIESAVDKAVARVLSHENATLFWTVGFTMMQQRATQQAGKAAFSIVGTVLRKATLFLVLGGLVYSYGGWTALAAMVKAVKDL